MNTLTLPVCKKKEKNIERTIEGLQINISEKIDEVAFVWNRLAGANVFLSQEYLKCLEEYPADGISPYYAIIKKDGECIGIAYFQWKFFRLRENIRKSDDQKNVTQRLKRAVIHTVNFPTLVCGNLLLTGRHGFVFQSDVKPEDQWKYLDQAVIAVKNHLQQKGRPVGLVLAKDFYVSQKKHIQENSFVEFQVQPTMNMKLDSEWKDFSDYAEAMKSKYRVRLKKAKKDIHPVHSKVFDVSDIEKHRDTIFSLYENISNQADFNTFLLDPFYFEKLKKCLKDACTFTAYFENENMVGFSTTIVNDGHLHAHFLGYDKTINQRCQLYLNMLYDIVNQAIDKQLPEIDFSRTAIEIKSTVGAQDIPLFLYLKHLNPVWNSFVSPILNLVKPDSNYVIRHPFRDE